MIPYKYPEEKIVALQFASLLNDEITKTILQKDKVESREEAIHLSQFFWRMIEKSAAENIQLQCEGSSEHWTEKLYNSIGGYLDATEWDEEIDKA